MKKNKILSVFFIVFTTFFIAVNNVYADNFRCEALDVLIDVQLAKIVRYVILGLQIAVPVILVIYGMLDLMKSIAAQKEDEIKKGQQIFIKRLIAAALVFFVVAIVKFCISIVAKNTEGNIINCVNCFVKGTSKSDGCS